MGFLFPSIVYSDSTLKDKHLPLQAKKNLNIEVKGDRFYIDVIDTELTTVLRELSQKSNIPIIFGDGIQM
jgi:hypothetical protein